ncbi:hypothetical protein ACTHSJ_33755 [Paenibacillus cellulositrophicus]|uniref:hypothetical protein n=1 Tax=Paenibacillus cellulositrophicus TaxID=562959 RepID=UPI003F7F4B00
MKVVINGSKGPFNISQLGYKELVNLGWQTTTCSEDGELYDKDAFISIYQGIYSFTFHAAHSKKIRTNPEFVNLVSNFGDKINSNESKMKIIDIPDNVDWEIEEWNGLYEIIREKSRIWY